MKKSGPGPGFFLEENSLLSYLAIELLVERGYLRQELPQQARPGNHNLPASYRQ